MKEKPEPVDYFRNASDRVVVRPFLYPDDAEKSKDYIKNLVDYENEVPNPNIDSLRREIGDTHQFCVKIEFASGSEHERDHDEDQVQEQDLGGMAKESIMVMVRFSGKRIRKTLQFANAKKTKVRLLILAIDSEDRSPDGRIIDVLAQIHDEDDIEEFRDDAQNAYETANEEVV
ncbi:hypothetical protein K7X08_010380 [Anisodus acutangulus]|uniref:Uncharacterized protein n=1 Tax=Anisodus acutangulus TaxID=402998 RepID=A0A9Q1N185_9SOLA|nr:hypothetical protein K7X08_010380 [Anisodus acutangulus]